MAKGWSFGGLVAALKDAAFKSTGTTAGTVAAGDDGRIVNAVQRTGDKMTGQLKLSAVSNGDVLRIFDTVYGAIFRRSENSLHIIPTAQGASNAENGTFGPLRPLSIGLDNGIVTNAHGLAMTSTNGAMKSDYYTNYNILNDSNLPKGTGGFSSQFGNAAPYYMDNATITVGSGGVYVPLIKHKTTRNNAGWGTAVSFGTLMPGGANKFGNAAIHAIGDSGTSAVWLFDPNDGSFGLNGSVRAGTASFNGDGNIAGTLWGTGGGNVGDLYGYLANNYIKQDGASFAGFADGNINRPYIRGRGTGEVAILARQDWTNLYFLQDVRYAGVGVADNGNNDNLYAEAPSPSTVIAVQQKTNYTAVKYTNLQMNRNGTWILVGRV